MARTPSAVFKRSTDPDDLLRLKRTVDAMGSERAAGYFQRIAQDLGDSVAQDVLRKVGDLNPSRLATLSERGRLDNLAEAIRYNLPEDKLRDCVGWLEASKAGRARRRDGGPARPRGRAAARRWQRRSSNRRTRRSTRPSG